MFDAQLEIPADVQLKRSAWIVYVLCINRENENLTVNLLIKFPILSVF